MYGSIFTSTNRLSTTPIDTEKYFENDNTIFDIKKLSAFIKNSIGYEYYNTYKTYFDNLFEKCEKNSYYIKTSNEKDYMDLINILYNKLIDIKSFYTMKLSEDNQAVKNGFKSKSLYDVECILTLLYKLEKISNTVISNAFQNFSKKLKHNIVNTDYKKLPRSIINFSAFKFCIPGYPYETKSGKVYSISNMYTNDMRENIKLYYKNLNALLNFLDDIDISTKDDNNYELNILKLSYGVSIVLIAISAEEDQYESILRKYYSSGR